MGLILSEDQLILRDMAKSFCEEKSQIISSTCERGSICSSVTVNVWLHFWHEVA